MPLQNRVNPWGELVAVTARGTWLGNRGILHDAHKNIVKQSANPHWITCQLAFKGRQRTPFSVGSYSELFFLDEATALAAGHRPCSECRRERYNEFKSAWLAANPNRVTSPSPQIAEIDKILHQERMTRTGKKVTFEAYLSELASGIMIAQDNQAFLLWQGRLYPWSFEGYGAPLPLPAATTQVQVLTPASMVKMLAYGFTPQVHESAMS